ncbi:oligosaccharide flippase family protein [Nonlabens sp. SCSIO 43208]
MKDFLNKINSKDGRSLLENFFSLGALQIINLLSPLLVLPYMIRTVGFEKYGILVLASSLITYFSSITDYSFKITATRDVAVFRDSPKKLDLIYSRVISVKSLLLIISWILIAIIVYSYQPFYEEKLVYSCSSLMLLGYVLFPEWYFQGIEKMKYITFLNVGIKLFFTICIFVLIKNPEDYWKYSLLNSLGYIGAGIIGQYILMKKYKLKFIWLKMKFVKFCLKENFPIFINQFIPNLYNNTSTFLLGILTSTQIVGVYAAIKKVIDIGITIINVSSRVIFPYLNRNKNSFDYYKKTMMVIGLVLVIIPVIFHDLIFWYLDIIDDSALRVLIILSIGLFFFMLYNVFGMNYFIVNRMDRLVMKNTILASLIGLITCFPLIHYFGLIGAALNLTICRFIMGGSLYYKYLRIGK